MNVEEPLVREQPQAIESGRTNSTPSTPLLGGNLPRDRQVRSPNLTGNGQQVNGQGVIIEESDEEEPEWVAPQREGGNLSVRSDAFEAPVYFYDDLISNLDHCNGLGSVIGSVVMGRDDGQGDPASGQETSAPGSVAGDREFTVPRVLQAALLRIEEGFQQIRIQEAQRDRDQQEVVQGLGVRLRSRFQEVKSRQSQLKKDISDTREEIRQVGDQVQLLWDRPIVTEEALNAVSGQLWDRPMVTEDILKAVTSDLRKGAEELEHKVIEAERRTREIIRTANGEIQELTVRFEDFTEQVCAGGQAPQRMDTNQRFRSRSPQGSGPAEPTKTMAAPESPLKCKHSLNEQTEMLTKSLAQTLGRVADGTQPPQTPAEHQHQLILGNEEGRP